MDDVRRVALADQAAAATRAARDIDAWQDRHASFRSQATPGPFMARCVEAALDIGRTGQLTVCPHLHPGPRPAYWWPRMPTRLMCGPCSAPLVEAWYAGDVPCDRCRLVTPAAEITMNSHTKPGMVDDQAGPLLAVPPITLRCVLCRACQRVEDGNT